MNDPRNSHTLKLREPGGLYDTTNNSVTVVAGSMFGWHFLFTPVFPHSDMTTQQLRDGFIVFVMTGALQKDAARTCSDLDLD